MRAFFSGRPGLWLLLIVSLAFNVGFGTTYGVKTYRQRGCGAGLGGESPCSDINAKLNLTAEQQTRIDAAKDRLMEQIASVQAELTAEREALAGVLATAEPDHSAIAQRLGRIGALQQQIQQRCVDHLLEEKALLTPAQRETFNDLIRHRV